MDKEQRMEYMRNRFPKIQESIGESADAVLAVGKHDIKEEMEIGLADTYREHRRDTKETLTSDE